MSTVTPTGECVDISPFKLACIRFMDWLKSPSPYFNILGIAGFLLAWFLFTEYWKLPLFNKLPGPMSSFSEWVSRDPIYGISLYTPDYYHHIGVSIWRVFQAFVLATVLGVPVGLFMGWKKPLKITPFRCLRSCAPSPCWPGCRLPF